MSRILAANNDALIVPYRAPHELQYEFSLIIPTYNEAANIEALVESVDRTLRPILQNRWELIVVDDSSPDATGAIVERLFARFPTLRLVQRTGARGPASAVIRGWQAATGRLLATMNSDFQHPPEILPSMLRELDNADVVVATRYAGGGQIGKWSFTRRIATALARRVGESAVPDVFQKVSDPLSGYYAFHRECIEGVLLQPLGFKSLIELLARGRVATVRECGYAFSERARGKSNLRVIDCIRYMVHLGRLKRATR